MTTKRIAPSFTSGEPIHSGYALIPRAHFVNVTSLAHKRWKRAHPEVCRNMGIT